MLQYRRPVFVCGENPGMTLFAPGTEEVIALASYWQCTYSPHGSGRALTVWVAPHPHGPHAEPFGGIFTDNMPLARWLTESLTRYFPEFRPYPVLEFPYHASEFQQTNDGQNSYAVQCTGGGHRINVTWADWLDQKQLTWPRFSLGSQFFDLINVTFPCGRAGIQLDGLAISGVVQTDVVNGKPASTAFLALCETWIGPLPPEEGAETSAPGQ